MRRAAEYIATFATFAAIGVVLALLLGGCAAPQALRGSGTPAMPPEGYSKLCTDQPNFEGCTP